MIQWLLDYDSRSESDTILSAPAWEQNSRNGNPGIQNENSSQINQRLLALFQLTNKEASTVFCSVVKHAGSGRAPHTRGFFICFMIKNSIISPRIR